MLRINALQRTVQTDGSGRTLVYSAELYETAGHSEQLDWRCEHDHDNRFAALMCGQDELRIRQARNIRRERAKV